MWVESLKLSRFRLLGQDSHSCLHKPRNKTSQMWTRRLSCFGQWHGGGSEEKGLGSSIAQVAQVAGMVSSSLGQFRHGGSINTMLAELLFVFLQVFAQIFNHADPGAINLIGALAALKNVDNATITASNAGGVTASPQVDSSRNPLIPRPTVHSCSLLQGPSCILE